MTFLGFPDKQNQEGEMKMTEEQMGFKVVGGGDSSVGIPNWDVSVIIDGNERDVDEDSIKQWKEFLREYYDVDIMNVYTFQEWDAEIKAKE